MSNNRSGGALRKIGLPAFAAIMAACPALAQDRGQVSIGFARSEAVDSNAARWVVCYSVDFDAKENYVGSIIATTYKNTADNNGNVRWRETLKEKYGLDKSLYGGCNVEESDADAQWRYGEFTKPNLTHPKRIILVDWQMKPAATKIEGKKKDISPGTSDASAASPPPVAPPKYVEVQGPNGTMRLSPEVIARNAAAADDHKRKLEEHAENVARAKAEQDIATAKHAENVAAAAVARREYEQRLATNAAQVAANQAAALEGQKLRSKPGGVNAVYRGFNGPTCEIARRSALFGAGTSKGTKFAEVTQDLSGMPRTCNVQGWWWNTSKTGSSRQ